MELIYIGDRFYNESGTIMSSLYTLDGKRSDWGFVNCALRNGEAVYIRPADDDEVSVFQQRLDAIKAERENKA